MSVGGRIEYKEAEFGSSEQLDAIDLRRRILRLPLGLDFTPAELAAEAHEFHLVAVDREEVVACLVLTPLAEHEIKMRQVAVDPLRQSEGIGKALVEFSETIASQRGFKRMVLHARDTAVPFYLRLGYAIEGDPFEEVSIPHRKMAKSLID